MAINVNDRILTQTLFKKELNDIPTCTVCGNEIACHEDGCDVCSDPCVEISIEIEELGIHGYLYAHNSGDCPEKLKQLELKPVLSLVKRDIASNLK